MKFGIKEDKLQAFAEESEIDVPALRQKPKLPIEGVEMVSAFNTLSSLRTSNGFGHNPISMSDIKCYIDLMGQPFYDVKVFIDLLIQMDTRYLEMNEG